MLTDDRIQIQAFLNSRLRQFAETKSQLNCQQLLQHLEQTQSYKKLADEVIFSYLTDKTCLGKCNVNLTLNIFPMLKGRYTFFITIRVS